MSVLKPDETRAMREALSTEAKTAGSLAERWEDLNKAAVQLAMAADLAPERQDARIARFPAMVGNAHEWQRELAWQGIEDIDAMMRPGLSALSTLSDRGHDATAPALTLWREFYRAREAVVSLVDPVEETS